MMLGVVVSPRFENREGMGQLHSEANLKGRPNPPNVVKRLKRRDRGYPVKMRSLADPV